MRIKPFYYMVFLFVCLFFICRIFKSCFVFRLCLTSLKLVVLVILERMLVYSHLFKLFLGFGLVMLCLKNACQVGDMII